MDGGNAKSGLTTQKVLLFGVIFALLVFSFWILFPKKLECSADGPVHALGAWFYQDSLKNYGRVPWTNPNQSAGAIFSIFYSSIFYTIAAVLSFVLNYLYSIKIVIVLSYVFSIYAMYLLAKEYGFGRNESILAGIIFSFSNWFVFSTFFRGAYLDLIGRAFLPLSLLYLKRGVKKEFFSFIMATTLMLASNQSSAIFFMPAILGYGVINNRRDLKRLLLAFLFLGGLVLFYAVPYSYMQKEAYSFDLSLKIPPAIPVSLLLPQWGLRYDAYGFVGSWSSLDSAYVGIFHALLAAIGAAFFWRKYPGQAFLLAYALVLMTGLFQDLSPIRFSARYLFLLAVPLSFFAVSGMEKLKKLPLKIGLLAPLVVFINAAGAVFMLQVYASRANLHIGLLLPAVLALLLVILVAVAHKTKAVGYYGLVMLLLIVDVLPNAFNPTMVTPGPSQINPCSYPTGRHEFIANNFCAADCDGVYVYRPGSSFVGSKKLMTIYENESVGSSRCPESLARLGIRYCFERGKPFEFKQPASFVESTSNFTLTEDSPDRISLAFDEPGKTVLRLGFFSEYRAVSEENPDGKIRIRQTEDGFMEFDNPKGRVKIVFFPPIEFFASYMASFLIGVACAFRQLAGKPKSERLLLVTIFSFLLLHMGLRLFDMLSLYLAF